MSVGLIEIPGYVTGTWRIDLAHSDAGFAIRHLMISNIKGTSPSSRARSSRRRIR